MSLPLFHVAFHSALCNIQRPENARRIIFNNVLRCITELLQRRKCHVAGGGAQLKLMTFHCSVCIKPEFIRSVQYSIKWFLGFALLSPHKPADYKRINDCILKLLILKLGICSITAACCRLWHQIFPSNLHLFIPYKLPGNSFSDSTDGWTIPLAAGGYILIRPN